MGRYTGENIQKDVENHGFSHGKSLGKWSAFLGLSMVFMAFPYRAVSLQDCKPQGWPIWMNRTGNIGDPFYAILDMHASNKKTGWRDGQRPSGLSTKTSLEYINNQWSCLNGYVTCWFPNISQLLNSSVCVAQYNVHGRVSCLKAPPHSHDL